MTKPTLIEQTEVLFEELEMLLNKYPETVAQLGIGIFLLEMIEKRTPHGFDRLTKELEFFNNSGAQALSAIDDAEEGEIK